MFMHLKSSKILVFIALLLGAQGTPALGDAGRVEAFDTAFSDFLNRGGKGKAVEEQRRNFTRLAFSDWKDEDLTATAIDWAFAQSDDPYVGLNLRNFLQDLNRPTDSGELRRHLRRTMDSRDSYKLLHLTKLFPDEEFVSELAHLLYNTDLNSDRIQEWEPGRICDNVYNKIAIYLQRADVDYVPPKLADVRNPDEEAIQPMIRWLAENWDGCEHLITTTSRPDRPDPLGHTQSSKDSTIGGREAAIHDISGDKGHVDLRWIVSGGVLFSFAVAYALVKWRRFKPN